MPTSTPPLARLRLLLASRRGRLMLLALVVVLVLVVRHRANAAAAVTDVTSTDTSGALEPGSSTTPADAGGMVVSPGTSPNEQSATPYDPWSAYAPIYQALSDYTAAHPAATAPSAADIAAATAAAIGPYFAALDPGDPTPTVPGAGGQTSPAVPGNAAVTASGLWWDGVFLRNASDLAKWRAQHGLATAGPSYDVWLAQHPGAAMALGIKPLPPPPVAPTPRPVTVEQAPTRVVDYPMPVGRTTPAPAAAAVVPTVHPPAPAIATAGLAGSPVLGPPAPPNLSTAGAPGSRVLGPPLPQTMAGKPGSPVAGPPAPPRPVTVVKPAPPPPKPKPIVAKLPKNSSPGGRGGV